VKVPKPGRVSSLLSDYDGQELTVRRYLWTQRIHEHVRMRRFNLTDPNFEYDPEDPEGFRAGMFRLGPDMGAEQTGASLYELPPGELLCPYHYEYGEEEWLLVLEGEPWLRTPEGTATLAPLDVVFFPRGPEGAHQVGNKTDSTARVLMWSNVVFPTATEYPDSGKLGMWPGDRGEKLMVERSSGVDYYLGETV
jgi:uncharacterized cupin superfamily protein